jgi:hypothetical protein
VARVFNPGCKVDTATVLAGTQGLFKSEYWKTLASPDWFCDDFNDVDNKDHLLKLHEAWIIEWPELHGLTRKESNRVKSFMTTARDRIRRPYGREAEWMKRPSILVGSSNDKEFLSDSTGNRRWWIIPVAQKIDIEKLKAKRDQIWALAVDAYKRGEPWWLTDDEEQAAEATRKQFEEADPWHDAIANYLEDKKQVSLTELFDQVLKIETGRQGRPEKTRITNILRRCGWDAAPNGVMHLGIRQRVWKPKNISNLGLYKTAVPAVQPCQNGHRAVSESNTGQHGNGTAGISAVPENNLQHGWHGAEASAVPSTVPEKTFSQIELQPVGTASTAGTVNSLEPQNKMFSPGDRVRKRGKQGWRGDVKRELGNGRFEVSWLGDPHSVEELESDLELIVVESKGRR